MSRQCIQDALIVPGDGKTDPFSGDILIEGSHIKSLGSVSHSDKKTARVYNAAGMTVAPGFVDTHNHGALGGVKLSRYGIPIACEMALRAGVVKRLCGVDGFSPAPVLPHQRKAYAEQLRPLDGDTGSPWTWSTMEEFYSWHQGKSLTDVGFYLGHSAIRRTIMGNAPRKATPDELRQMADLVKKEAPSTLGFSTGLVYNPAVYSDSLELAELLRAYQSVAPAALFPHLRSESDLILPSLDECLRACVETKTAYCNEHSKIAGKKNYQKIGKLEERLSDAGHQIKLMGNLYPYTAGSTTGDACFPPEFRAGSREQFKAALKDPASRKRMYELIVGDTTSWDNFIGFCGGLEGIQIAGAPNSPQFLGKRLGDVARAANSPDLQSFPAYEAVFNFFLENNMDITIISHYGSELVSERLFRRKDMAICTDGLMPGPGKKPHPRSLGAFPKALRMARELGIQLKEIIWRMSVLPCEFLGLESPVLRLGADASLTLFDWENVREMNDYEKPEIHPKGIHKVWIHGKLVFDEGTFPQHSKYPGLILRRPSRLRSDKWAIY